MEDDDAGRGVCFCSRHCNFRAFIRDTLYTDCNFEIVVSISVYSNEFFVALAAVWIKCPVCSFKVPGFCSCTQQLIGDCRDLKLLYAIAEADCQGQL